MIGVRLQSQSTSKKHNQVKKKPWYLCALQKKSQKYFGYACLIIIRFVILTIEQTKPFACSRCVICISWSRRTTRAKDHRNNEVGISDHVMFTAFIQRSVLKFEIQSELAWAICVKTFIPIIKSAKWLFLSEARFIGVNLALQKIKCQGTRTVWAIIP